MPAGTALPFRELRDLDVALRLPSSSLLSVMALSRLFSKNLSPNRDVPVAVTEIVRFRSPLIDGELQLKLSRGIAQVNEREAIEVEAFRWREIERGLVEGNGSLLVEHPNH